MALNTTSNQLSLNSVTRSFQLDPAPFGFRVDTGYGRTYDAFYNSEPKHTDWSQYLLNAFVSYKVKERKGIQFDFGRFVTSAGAEVTEAYLIELQRPTLPLNIGCGRSGQHRGDRVSTRINVKLQPITADS